MPALLAGMALCLGLGLALGSREPQKVTAQSLAATFALGLAALVASFAIPGVDRGVGMNLAAGLLLGGAVTLYGPLAGRLPAALASIGLAGIGGWPWLLGPVATPLPTWLAFAGGLGLAAVFARGSESVVGPAALMAAVFGAAETMGAAQIGPRVAHPGMILALTIALPLLLGASLARAEASLPVRLSVAAAMMGAGLFVAHRFLGVPGAEAVLLIAGVSAAVVTWVVTDEAEGSLPILAAGILWVAVGTIAFAESRGFGMAAAAMMGLGVFAVFGFPRSVVTSAPLIGLVLYRGMGTAFPEASRALDLGQHYALVGLMLGMLAVAAIVTAPEGGARAAVALAGLLALAFSPVLLGAKGAIGALVGVGLGPLVGSVAQRERSSLALGASATLAAALLVSFPMLRDRLDVSRAEKLALLSGVGVAIATLVVIALFLARPNSQMPAPEPKS